MNQIRNGICLLILFVSISNFSRGQEKKNTINISGIIAHYIGIYDYQQIAPAKGSYVFFLNPGAEVLYWRQFPHKIEFGTGINLQKVQAESKADIARGYTLRFQYHELSVPILLRKNFTLKNQNLWYVTVGIYNGKQLNIVSRYPTSVDWTRWDDLKTIAGYSSDHFFSDIYFDAGYSKSLDRWGGVSVSPFVSYRVNPTWLNNYENRTLWGVKLIYSFKF